jgi:hypothetical protein
MNTFTFVTTDPRLMELGCRIKSPVKLNTGQIYHFKGSARVVALERFTFGEWHVRGKVEEDEED